MAQGNGVVCPTCKGGAAMRINRAGFLQENVLWRFGIYPWKCGMCGTTFLQRRRRGERVSTDQAAAPSTAAEQQES